ncbi:aldehyde dehydrogenase family protein [Enterococcus sp. AZ196]|uniref:aldehyde dehydrogenase family protein n=1 Tax=Enterococcus sp. AZ196 TaxID=2774659 RepID=UPI003D2B616A
MQFVDKDLKSIQEARILTESARDAQFLLKDYDQQTIDRMLKKLITEVKESLPELVAFEVAATGKGNEKDKLSLWQIFLDQFAESLHEPVLGVLEDTGELKQIGVPLGVIAAILPGENILLNAFFATISALKGGNTIILIPQARTEAVVAKLYDVFQQSNAGFPKSSFCFMENTAIEGISVLTEQAAVALVVNIGHSSYFDCSKPTIYGAVGSTPVFIERTADIDHAVDEIITSRGFDNGLLPAAEQFVIAESVIASEVKEKMIRAGAHFMSSDEEKQLLSKLFLDNEVNPTVIGKDAKTLAKISGFPVAEGTRVLVSEQPYIFEENPFTNALPCPVMTYYLESDWIHACDKCIQLLKEKRNGHTLAIHSKNSAIIREFGLKKPIGRMLVNTGAGFAGIGLDSTLPVSMILGGMTTGRGYVAKNITAKDFTYVREIGYSTTKEIGLAGEKVEPITIDQQALLEKILRKIIE